MVSFSDPVASAIFFVRTVSVGPNVTPAVPKNFMFVGDGGQVTFSKPTPTDVRYTGFDSTAGMIGMPGSSMMPALTPWNFAVTEADRSFFASENVAPSSSP